MQQFDPNLPNLIEGNVTRVSVLDPAGTFPPFEVGNHVVRPDQEFKIGVAWEIRGPLRPLWLAALGGNWNVQVFAESIGGGPEVLIAQDTTVPADPSQSSYTVILPVPAGTLQEGNPAGGEPGQ